MKIGEVDSAYATISEWIRWGEERSREDELSELLRVKGEILCCRSPDDRVQSEECFLNSLRLANTRAELSLELRAGMSLARMWAQHGESDKALKLFAPIHARFTEGFGTRDLVAASGLLDELRASGRRSS
jgi:predicted ATPase